MAAGSIRPLRAAGPDAAVLALCGGGAAAQMLASPRFVCEFTRMCMPDLDRCAPAELSFEIEMRYGVSVPLVRGPEGEQAAMALPGDRVMSLLEPLPDGSLRTTTFSFTGQAVHSRHRLAGDHLLPAQYHGVCRGEE